MIDTLQAATTDGKAQTDAQVTLAGSGSATLTQVTRVAATPTQLVAANANRRGAIIANNSGSRCYLLFEDAPNLTVSNTKHILDLADGDVYELPMPIYTGHITVYWSSGSGNTIDVQEW